jgi:type III secretion protein U
MPEKNEGGDKTEKPTAKRLRDARKKAEVAKSKDVTSTVVLIVWIGLLSALSPYLLRILIQPMDQALQLIQHPSVYGLKSEGVSAVRALATAVLATLVPVAVIGLLTEFAQVGPILSMEKMKPKLDHMSPGEGLKRMFSVDNLFEAAKSLIKASLLVGLIWLVAASHFKDLTALARGGPDGMLAALGVMLRQLFMVTAMVFVLVASADAAYQRFSFTKKMRMSRRDIRQETKDSEGDPFIRRRRRQLHQEWAGRTAVEAARGATALVMNPTHIAVALEYDPEAHPAPIVSAKGSDSLAQAMREAAEAEGVPVIRNVAVARALNTRATINDVVPQDMFTAVAEVIVWARRMRDEAERKARTEAPSTEERLP